MKVAKQTAAAPWLEYRLESLEFQNGAKLGFRDARMLYNEGDHIIAIEQIGATPAEIDRALATIRNPDGTIPPIKTIFYAIRVEGHREPFFFYHPIQPGAGVQLLPREKGRTRLFFSQENGRPMFSKDWTLSDITAGKIRSDKKVWQFHGWRHEH